MQLFFRTLTIFLGTLIAAACVALGTGVFAELQVAPLTEPTWQSVIVALLGGAAR